ncbi:Uma2 family endonuclease [Kitasatospora sp. NPDC093558]|uniref:Uma2 family endonuclease n=1 Tax=Kitasatospora sp. NPDC093558 TaxID=3155201 RepID=UPI0034499D93
MSAALEEPFGRMTLLETAEMLSERLVGHRVEIIGGQITVTPPPDGPHGETLTDIMIPLWSAGLHGEDSRVVQGIGMWLPGGSSDYAIPDLSVVDADYRDHLIKHNCYDPAIFRLVVEVTSSNHLSDVKVKPGIYADAGVPAYLIVDRKNQKVMVLTEPRDGEYRVHAVHHPGQSFTLPESIGASVTLAVDDVLAAKK